MSLHVVLKWVLAICFCNLTDHWNQMFFLGKSASNHINRTSIWWSGCTSLGVWYVILLAFDNCLLFLLQITITANISEHALGTGLHPKGFIYIILHNSNPKAPWSSYFNYSHVMTNKLRFRKVKNKVKQNILKTTWPATSEVRIQTQCCEPHNPHYALQGTDDSSLPPTAQWRWSMCF